MDLLSKNSTPPGTETAPIWRLAFRSFFLGGCLFSVVAIALWWASLRGHITFAVYGNWLWWHAHEMIFGFACAIIVGFLLTAVQTWTGIKSLHGKPLAGLFTLWLCARLAMFLPLPAAMVTTLDAAFLFIAAIALALPLIKIRMYRNLVFIIVLLALMGLNIASHLATSNRENAMPYFHGAIMIIVLVITIMGGRVIPLFTNNALQIKPTPAPKFIGLSAIGSILLLIIFALVGFSSIPDILINTIVAIGVIAHSYRLICWFNKGMLSKPILWSLHVAYAFIPLGLLFMLLQSLNLGVTTSMVIHSFTVGGIGGLILAMISRVSLGHTGRPLVFPKPMPIALVILFLGALVRVFLPWVNMQFYGLAIDVAALFWGMAFSLFLFCYVPFLVRARVDGQMR